MRTKDNYTLTNASMAFKISNSLSLVLGIGLLIWSWHLSYIVIARYTGLDRTLEDGFYTLTQAHFNIFSALFAFQCLSYTVLLIVSKRLLRRSTLRRRIKNALVLLGNALVTFNLLAWLLVPISSLARHTLVPLGLLSSLLLILSPLPGLWQMWMYKRWKPNTDEVKRVTIIGGGFAGLYTALELDRALGYHQQLELTVIDQNNFFLFPPLLPSAAVGSIEMPDVTYPFRRIFETTNIIFKKGTVVSVNPTERHIRMHVHLNDDMVREKPETTGQDVKYDYLVLAPGAITQTFKIKGINENALFMRSLQDAVRVRNRIIECFEAAATTSDPILRRQLVQFTIVGGGATGIETATEIHDLIHQVLLGRYPEVDKSLPKVTIVQSGPQVLPGWSEDVVQKTTQQLNKLEVRLILNVRVTEVQPHHVLLSDGTTVEARTCIWCAGVKPSPLLESCGLSLDKTGRVVVTEDLRSNEFPNIFVLGDCATSIDKKTGKPLPPLGQVAFQQGTHTAKNLIHLLQGKPTKPFRYFNYGALVSVGEHYAAVNLLGVKLSGFVGWFIWRTLYLMKIIGMSNRFRIVIDWTLDLLIERSITQFNSDQKKLFTDDE